MLSVPWQASKAGASAARRPQEYGPWRKPRVDGGKERSPERAKETVCPRKPREIALLSPLRGSGVSGLVDPGLAPWAKFSAPLRGAFASTCTADTLPTHVPVPFDILGHRADDLVVPDPGPEHRSRFSGRIGSLPSGAEPHEGRVLQRYPQQGLTPSFSLYQRISDPDTENPQHGETRESGPRPR
jgi:hypothetical protein